jgi:2Fe-2S ferredoxin
MAVLIVTDREGKQSTLESDTGYSIMTILQSNGQDVAAICGGVCSCATCHVYVAPAWAAKLDAQSADEKMLTEESDWFKEGQSRLSCQIEFTDELNGIELTLAPED